MEKRELTDQPWMVFPALCSHGCGPFYSMEQIMATPCCPGKVGRDGLPYHHDFCSPPRNAKTPPPA